jgi:hypothetical protein
MEEPLNQNVGAEYIAGTYQSLLRADTPSSSIYRVRVRATIHVIHHVSRIGGRNPLDQSVILGYQIGQHDYAFSHVPYENDQFIWVVRQLARGDEASVAVLAQGERVAVDLKQLRPVESLSLIGPVWCPIANMTADRPYGPEGKERRPGSRHFAAGAKLYCFPGQGGDGYEQIQVVGRHRATHRYVSMIISSKWLVNRRVGLAYSPLVIDQLWPDWDGTERSKVKAAAIVSNMSRRSETREA